MDSNLGAGFAPTMPDRLTDGSARHAAVITSSGASLVGGDEPALTLFACGFSEVERRLLEGTIRLSQRRKPRLELIDEADARWADVVLIDGLAPWAVKWAESQVWLESRTAIWIDSKADRPAHTQSKRPVQWPILPMLLARALEESAERQPAAQSGLVPLADLPQAPVAGASVMAAKPPPPNTVRQVLVVDDSLAVRNHLRSLLEARGFGVSEASNVDEALGIVAHTRFDCVLMDVLMPNLDGYEGCRRIKALKSAIGRLPVVMLTSKSSPFDRIRGKMAGCDAYLTKPVEAVWLYETLSQQLAGGARAETLAVRTAANAADTARPPKVESPVRATSPVGIAQATTLTNTPTSANPPSSSPTARPHLPAPLNRRTDSLNPAPVIRPTAWQNSSARPVAPNIPTGSATVARPALATIPTVLSAATSLSRPSIPARIPEVPPAVRTTTVAWPMHPPNPSSAHLASEVARPAGSMSQAIAALWSKVKTPAHPSQPAVVPPGAQKQAASPTDVAKLTSPKSPFGSTTWPKTL